MTDTMNAEQSLFVFTAFARYYGGSNLARCNGQIASSTNSPEVAAASAAKKHFRKVCAVLCISADLFKCTTKTIADGQFLVTFQKPA